MPTDGETSYKFADSLEFFLLPSPSSAPLPLSAPPLSSINYGIASPFAEHPLPPKTHRHGKRSLGSSPLTASVPSLPFPNRVGGGGATTSGGRSRANSNTSQTTSRSTSPSDGRPRVDSATPLVADVQLVRTRLLIAKRYTIYNSAVVPWRSVIVGYTITFHTPPSSHSRVKDAELVLSFQSTNKAVDTAPIIKAISPGGSTFLGSLTQAERTKSTKIGLTLGYDSFGSLNVSRASTMGYKELTGAQLQVSGVESSRALITIQEDLSTHRGIPLTFNIALLLFLPSPTSNDFEVELSVAASVGAGVGEAWKRLFGSPRAWLMGYDGVTEMGVLNIGTLDERDGALSVEEGEKKKKEEAEEGTGSKGGGLLLPSG